MNERESRYRSSVDTPASTGVTTYPSSTTASTDLNSYSSLPPGRVVGPKLPLALEVQNPVPLPMFEASRTPLPGPHYSIPRSTCVLPSYPLPTDLSLSRPVLLNSRSPSGPSRVSPGNQESLNEIPPAVAFLHSRPLVQLPFHLTLPPEVVNTPLEVRSYRYSDPRASFTPTEVFVIFYLNEHLQPSVRLVGP